MLKDLKSSLIAVVLTTLVFGLAYPLAFTGVSQLLFPGNADGSKATVDGKVVGSKLIAQQAFKLAPVPKGVKKPDGRTVVRVPDPAYFQPRPSATGYDPSVTFFGNLGPNSKDARNVFKGNLDAYLKLEGPYDPELSAAQVPIDAVTESASGVDPDISVANAHVQAHRIAAVRHLSLDRVNSLISDHTDGRFLGIFGEPGVNVLELNLALDKEAPTK
jgi:potassium-transporting ATPase KdpC subunit